ncbi:hypothetical protein KUCAC02_023901 [Chaenocephalus aceratus]|uniref:Uncharacterized protein n=1 Tax=Chaenocephalus aceratus TaxID=36190 RepID=A0ACB9WHR0_CHAAC|nr:hypothetical protein KUCAC02_023901 [Chaenocephalus aceratus]
MNNISIRFTISVKTNKQTTHCSICLNCSPPCSAL